MPDTHGKSSASTGPPAVVAAYSSDEINDILPDATAWWSTWADCQQEIAEFVSTRIAKDQDIVRSVFTVHSLTDVFEVQSRWMSEASQDYSVEAIKFAALSTANVPVLEPGLRFPD
ncbi:MAG: hypothetical protein JWM36_1891 [Hyphomicrobiales bacterium]|nr:hypothetical protein [Hyphomicrobiales bacterium]